MREPTQYLASSATRIPLLLADLVFGYPAEWWYGTPPWALRLVLRGALPAEWFSVGKLHALHASLAIGALFLVVWGAFRLNRTLTEPGSRATLWLLLGAVCSLVPLCGVFPMSRLTVGPAVGVHAALAWVVVRAFRCMTKPAAFASRAAAAGLIALVVAVHGVYVTGAVALPLAAGRRSRDSRSGCAAPAIDDVGLANRHVIVVSAQDLATPCTALPCIAPPRLEMSVTCETLKSCYHPALANLS